MQDKGIFRTYYLDYLGKYYFYEEDEFVAYRKDGEYILENLKKGNRFDYDGASFTFTKFGNISEGYTERNVSLDIIENDINVKINGETKHLDLIYKMDVKELEDHIRITTRISEKGGEISCLLYVKLEDKESILKALESIKNLQIEFGKPKKDI